MHRRHFTTEALAVLSLLLSPVLACSPPANTNVTGYPRFNLGPDVRPEQATAGYFVNHFSLIVGNLTASLDFYTRILGMRLIFTFEASDWYSISYLSYSHGGRNGSGWQHTEELNRQKNNIEGLVELIYREDMPGGPLPGSTQMASSFSHYGLVVQDIEETQRRMEANNVPILKRIGEMPERTEAIKNAYGLRNATEAEGDVILAAMEFTGTRRFLFVTDPDGNYIEIQPQHYPEVAG